MVGCRSLYFVGGPGRGEHHGLENSVTYQKDGKPETETVGFPEVSYLNELIRRPSRHSMNMDPFSDSNIVDAWRKNATPWITAVRERLIESRKLCTDQAIVDAVLSCAPRTVVDLGCGEGWLTHKLSDQGLHVLGIDVVQEFVEEAQQDRTGEFRVLSYEEIVEGKLDVTVDAIVCNFSLLGKESVEGVIRVASRLLNPRGVLIVQTLHPLNECGDDSYLDGWREGSWAGFGDNFTDPAPWYFRTLESWIRLFLTNGFQLREFREPIHPKSGKPASVIFIAEMVSAQ